MLSVPDSVLQAPELWEAQYSGCQLQQSDGRDQTLKRRIDEQAKEIRTLKDQLAVITKKLDEKSRDQHGEYSCIIIE
jgi:hypothetical protein